MDKYELSTGKGRTRVSLLAYYVGSDLIVCIYNENAHIGAVALGEYDHQEKRASCSVITRLGHKDDVVAQEAAHSISKRTRKPVCVVVGIHLDKIIASEIDGILENAGSLVARLCAALEEG
jgi:hypothetical protein